MYVSRKPAASQQNMRKTFGLKIFLFIIFRTTYFRISKKIRKVPKWVLKAGEKTDSWKKSKISYCLLRGWNLRLTHPWKSACGWSITDRGDPGFLSMFVFSQCWQVPWRTAPTTFWPPGRRRNPGGTSEAGLLFLKKRSMFTMTWIFVDL